MNKDIIEGKWHEVKGKLKQQWGKITDDDVLKMKGNYEELCGVIQERYGYQKDKAEKEVKDFIYKNKW